MKVILPKTLISIEGQFQKPVFFFAGPVRGGDDWQYQAYLALRQRLTAFHVAIPVRYPETHPIIKHREIGKENLFARQTNWERFYLSVAGESRAQGCIMFWLPCESKTEPRNDGSPYARDTYGELGEWRGRMMSRPKIRLVIGAEPNFPGLSQITANFNDALGYKFPIYSSLEATVEAAIHKVN